jgi:hypothetical protein
LHYKAAITGLDDPEMPVRVQAALALTEMILVHESGMFCFAVCRHRRFGDERYLVKTAVSPQVGKVVQGEWFYFFLLKATCNDGSSRFAETVGRYGSGHSQS